MVNYNQAAAHIRHSLGGQMSMNLDVLDVINNAGNFITSLHPWRWLEATSGDITIAAACTDFDAGGSAGVADFVELISYGPRATDSRLVSGEVAMYVSPEELNALTTSVTVGSDKNYFTITYESGVPKMKGKTNSTGAEVVIRYRKGWKPVTTTMANADTAFHLPAWMDGLFFGALRTFARGYEEEDVASLSRRAEELRFGPLLAAAIEIDSNLMQFTRHRTHIQADWSVPGKHAPGEPREVLPTR